MKRSRCVCGQVKSKMFAVCMDCARKNAAELLRLNQEIVDSGVCPKCKDKLVCSSQPLRWYQCLSVRCDFQTVSE